MNGKRYYKPRPSFGRIMLRIIIGAVVCLIIAAAVAYFAFGVRYKSVRTADGLKVKFFGVTENGNIKKGCIRYSTGVSAKIDLSGEKPKLTYSNGDVYEGDLDVALKEGVGKMR